MTSMSFKVAYKSMMFGTVSVVVRCIVAEKFGVALATFAARKATIELMHAVFRPYSTFGSVPCADYFFAFVSV